MTKQQMNWRLERVLSDRGLQVFPVETPRRNTVGLPNLLVVSSELKEHKWVQTRFGCRALTKRQLWLLLYVPLVHLVTYLPARGVWTVERRKYDSNKLEVVRTTPLASEVALFIYEVMELRAANKKWREVL
jgi:hypothetical protein